MEKILITGALGQIGSELTTRLQEVYGMKNVIATDINEPNPGELSEQSVFEVLDVMDREAMNQLIEKHKPDTLIHLAALLSAEAEKDPPLAWNLNMRGLIHALEAARIFGLRFFTPSSIGSFGPQTPKDHTPQVTIQRPATMYGITKISGELLCEYYFTKYGVDTRSVRFPGLISYETLPGGGTTDYAVHIFYEALRKKTYASFIAEGTQMDMMYMPDALDCIIQLMEADASKLVHRNAYNVSAMSFAPEEIAAVIKQHLPEFELTYDVDPVRQGIAESWPNSIDTTCAKKEWGFNAEYDLDKMVRDMLVKLNAKLGTNVQLKHESIS